MKLLKNKKVILSHAILASSVFATSIAYAASHVTGINVVDSLYTIIPPLLTSDPTQTGSGADDIQIDSTGQVFQVSNVPTIVPYALKIDTQNDLTIDSNTLPGNLAIYNHDNFLGFGQGINALQKTRIDIAANAVIQGDIGALVITLPAGDTIAVNNDGTLKATAAGIFSDAIVISGTTTVGDIHNTANGSILGESGAIFLGSDFGTITNDNLIESNNANTAPTIRIGSSYILNSLTNNNSGIIKNTMGGTAIDFSVGSAQLLNAGTITGDVLLGKTPADPVLEMTDGQINGSVTALDSVVNQIDISGGKMIAPYILTLGDVGDTLNLSGGTLNVINGGASNDTFNWSGGSFVILDGKGNTGGVGNTLSIDLTIPTVLSTGKIIQNIQMININGGQFTQNGTMDNINTIDVENAGTVFTIQQPITNFNTLLKVGSGAKINVLTDLTAPADILNNGSFSIINNGSVNMASYSGTGVLSLFPKAQPAPGVANNFNLTLTSYQQNTSGNARGLLNVYIEDSTDYGAIHVTGAGPINFDAGTFIQPIVIGEPFIPSNTVFPIIQSDTGTVTDNGVTVLPSPSALYFFYKRIPPGVNEFDLVLGRRNLSLIALTPIAQSIAPTVNGIIAANGFGNPDFINLITQLDQLKTNQQLTYALEDLSPDVTYGMIEAVHMGMDRTFGTIWQRIEDIKEFREPWYGGSYRPYPSRGGYSYGDCANLCPYGIWIAPYGSWVQQKSIQYNAGYHAQALGGAIGYDRTFTNGTVWGMAGSFTVVQVQSSQGNLDNVENVNSLQGTIYGMWQPWDAVYVDLMFGIAGNKFQNNRNIDIGDIQLTAHSSFRGWQYGGQFDIGYVDCESDFYIIPVGRIKANYLHMQSFVERDAGALSLSTKERNLTQLLGGAGLRLVKEIQGYPFAYMPEISAIYLYDFSAQAQQTIANFVGGGTQFPTVGRRPTRNILLVDLAVEAFAVEQKLNVVTLRYECELRDKFIGQSGYVEFYHRWF